jgi:tRNA (adenine37-N6)-methyltransferase
MHRTEPVEAICYRPVGVVRSPFTEFDGMPLQSVAAGEVRGRIEIHPEFAPGLSDLDGFSHLHLITHLHRGVPGGLTVVPFLDDTERGIFSRRARVRRVPLDTVTLCRQPKSTTRRA